MLKGLQTMPRSHEARRAYTPHGLRRGESRSRFSEGLPERRPFARKRLRRRRGAPERPA